MVKVALGNHGMFSPGFVTILLLFVAPPFLCAEEIPYLPGGIELHAAISAFFLVST